MDNQHTKTANRLARNVAAASTFLNVRPRIRPARRTQQTRSIILMDGTGKDELSALTEQSRSRPRSENERQPAQHHN